MNENGKAAIIIVFCNASNPLTDNNMIAITDNVIPQANFTLFGGVRDPLVDCIPRTKVAESAEVMKKEPINNTAKTEIPVEKGIIWNISKIVNSVDACAKSAMPLF